MHDVEPALLNWGRYRRLDYNLHGPGSEPTVGLTSIEYRALGIDGKIIVDDANNFTQIDEPWALDTQKAMVRLSLRFIDSATHLAHSYRDGWRVSKLKLRVARYRLWRVM